MRRLTMIAVAAAILAGGMLMASPADAKAKAKSWYDVNGAVKSGKMCLVVTDSSRGFGFWQKCPKPAKAKKAKKAGMAKKGKKK